MIVPISKDKQLKVLGPLPQSLHSRDQGNVKSLLTIYLNFSEMVVPELWSDGYVGLQTCLLFNHFYDAIKPKITV